MHTPCQQIFWCVIKKILPEEKSGNFKFKDFLKFYNIKDEMNLDVLLNINEINQFGFTNIEIN